MAGGGIKGGISYGNTDEFGYNAEENVVHVRDFHATMLHQLGIQSQLFTHSTKDSTSASPWVDEEAHASRISWPRKLLGTEHLSRCTNCANPKKT